MESTPQATWDAKFGLRKCEKVAEKYICLRHLRRIQTKGNSTMKTLIFLFGVAVMLGLASCASEPATTTTTTTHETTTMAAPATTQQTTTTRASGGY